jgi:leucyl-tRNA synthetase
MYEKGLAYKKQSSVNWCEKCETVLANEQVQDSKCWRCNETITSKEIEQWFLNITNYALELLDELDTLNEWPERVKNQLDINTCFIKLHHIDDQSRLLEF